MSDEQQVEQSNSDATLSPVERKPKRSGGNRGNHGAPGRSGRKPTAVTLLKRRLVQDKIEEAEASFAFLVAVRDNDDEPTALRVAAAETILDRVLGKAMQMTGEAGEKELTAYKARIQKWLNEPEPTSATESGELGGSALSAATAPSANSQ